MRVLLGIMLMGLVVSPVEAAVLWFGGAETGDLREFQGGFIGSVITVTSPVRSGNYAYGGWFASAGITPGGFNKTELYIRGYWRHSILTNTTAPLVRTRNTSNLDQLAVVIVNSGRLSFNYAGGSLLETGTWVLSPNTWYLIEAKFVIDATNGGAEVKIDGVTQFSSFTHNTATRGNMDHVVFSFTGVNLDSGFSDDLAISDSGYLGRGRIIARQGTSGSPTYNAWTKNGCSGGVIENCWSNTPFTTGSNASSTTPTDAQTMLVHSFSTTQSGHGTETIGGSDHINACKMAVIAKASVGSQMYMRRRVGGVDTDTLLNLSATDTYYDDCCWTDTLTNINGAEIGAVQNSGP